MHASKFSIERYFALTFFLSLPMCPQNVTNQEDLLLNVEGCLSWWANIGCSDDGFDWLPKLRPYTRMCQLEECKEAYDIYQSYITLKVADKPDDGDLLEKNVRIFFVDLRSRGLVK